MPSMDDFGYEKLEVWQRSVELSCNIIGIVDKLNTPRHHLRLIEQLEAASTSVPMNIAEGKGRYSKKEFVHFLYIARGSLYETVTLLEIFARLTWLDKEAFASIKNQTAEIAKMLNALINSIKKDTVHS